MHRRSVVLGATVVLALCVGAPASSTGASASLDLTVAPKPVVTEGGRVLASARFTNEGAFRLADVKISFEIPAGSFESATPADGCSVSGYDGSVVTCVVGKVLGGQTVEQFVALTAPEGASEAEVVAKASFKGDGGHPRVDSDSTGVTAAGNPNEVGTCSSVAGTLATEPATGAGNPQSTSVAFSESVVLPCTPVSVGEQERAPGNPGCPPDETCTTQVSFVTIPALPEPAIVTITFTRDVLAPGTKPKNFVLWETPDKFPDQPIRQVQACPIPAGEDSCIVKVKKTRKKGLEVVLKVVGSGEDPRYTG